ncbi:MAG: DUF1214 domain-containing protein [Myxococcota bacterium]|nr:hypothetical protein [Deltaproteobacteria bacterium]MCP4241161.1 DUF1214 domain-containing protein [bacterium]MDP6075127.1 DUF1214 domain-containing protein [Myxococcota bacterium]MDP6242891.1 DUF1214 domain-containing protein [Myxococcota bacterium]MDP7074763.1 DUF1214 domain-containing protein [Myxococcota bacterium]
MAQGDTEKRIVDGTVWRDFCRALEEAGDAILREGTPGDPFQRAEGIRYLSRLARAGLESFVESSDPLFPRFFQLSNDTIKIGNDNPDNIYHNARVSGAHEYRIRGKRGSVPYLTFGTKSGGYETDGTMVPTGQFDLAVTSCESDGSFEILVSCEEKPGNWLPMQPETNSIVVRQTFEHRDKEAAAEYTIECLDARGSDSLRPETLEPALQHAAQFVKGTANLFVDWMNLFQKHTNALPPNDQKMCQRAGGDSNIFYHNSHWKLGPDEALVIELMPPECTAWNLQLSNFWMESLDFRYHRIHVNKHTAVYESDGSVRIVVAHRAPGPRWPNWLETCDHEEGAMLFRYVGAVETPPIAARVVRFEDLGE